MDMQKEGVEKAAGSADVPVAPPPKSPHPRSPPPRDPASPAAETELPGSPGSSRSTDRDYLDSLVPPSPDEFNRIMQIQSSREQVHRSQARSPKHRTAEMSSAAKTYRPETLAMVRQGPRSPLERSASPDRPAIVEDIKLTRAAALIQRTYRGYLVRRQMPGLNINASKRWTYALRDARFREATKPRPRGESPRPPTSADTGTAGGGGTEGCSKDDRAAAARLKWRKAAIVAQRAACDQDPDSVAEPADPDESSHSDLTQNSTSRERREATKGHKRNVKPRGPGKTMGSKYFLEMMDEKHRYGSNLRSYHDVWEKAGSREGFFYWLEYGEGRELDLDSCPRKRLDGEQVRYLGVDERPYYLVTVDNEGRLCWAKNNTPIDTTEAWKDSIHGIVPIDDKTPEWKPTPTAHNTQPCAFGSTGENGADKDSDDELAAARAAKYATPGLDEAKGLKKVRHISTATIFNKMLRKSVRKNTWIFVSDTSFRLYVGIKKSGAFQHSSFLAGGRISAAGLIKVKNGTLKSLSPLSGHYRPPAANFREFVKSLKATGVDMTHVSISKSYGVLVGLEVYSKTLEKGKSAAKKAALQKEKVMRPEEAAKRAEQERDKTESAARERAVLEREAKERAEAHGLPQLMRKLQVRKSGGGGQEEAGDGDKEGGSAGPVSLGRT